jgi:hypothetical protein
MTPYERFRQKLEELKNKKSNVTVVEEQVGKVSTSFLPAKKIEEKFKIDEFESIQVHNKNNMLEM